MSCVCNIVQTPMGTLESMCSLSAVHPDPIADAGVSELPFANRPDSLEDACDLKCARPDTHLTHPDGT
jgi:hypothetical protein